MTKRMHGRIENVWEKTPGTVLLSDAAAGATVLYVEDVSPFNSQGAGGGWITVGGLAAVQYTGIDDDASTITLADPLPDTVTVDSEDFSVLVWDDLYDELDTIQYASVRPDGKRDQGDNVEAVVSDDVQDLVNGDRGRPRESCVLERDGDDWELVHVKGRPSRAKEVRWEQDDFYTLTAADITAGSATMPLSHRPNDEALTCVLAGVPQRPTEWTIDYAAQTLTITLSGWEQAGDVLWVHYAYRKGIATPVISTALSSLVVVGATTIKDSDASSIALPVGTQAGDLIVLAAASNATVSMSDARMTQQLAGSDYGQGKLWTGIADGSGLPVGLSITTLTGFHYSAASMVVFRGPATVGAVVAEAGAAGLSIESVATKMAVVAAFSGYDTVDGALSLPAGWTQCPDDDGTGKWDCRIAYWNGATSGSPASTWSGSGGFVSTRFGGMVVGVS